MSRNESVHILDCNMGHYWVVIGNLEQSEFGDERCPHCGGIATVGQVATVVDLNDRQ